MSVRIELYIGSSFSEVITEMTHNDGSFAWCLFSGDIYDGSNYRIRISDYYDNSIYTFSDYFTIEIELTKTYFELYPLQWLLIIISLIIAVLTIVIILVRRHKRKGPKEKIIIIKEKSKAVKERELMYKLEEVSGIQERQILGKVFCSSCGAENLDRAGDFCSKCGAPIK